MPKVIIKENAVELSLYLLNKDFAPSLVRLIDKIYQSEQRIVIYDEDLERFEALDKTLWTFSKLGFVPHGNVTTGNPELQSVYFAAENEIIKNPNNSKILILVNLSNYEKYTQYYEKIIMFFDENNVEFVNKFYNDLKKNMKNVNYWKQSAKSWEKII